SPCTMTVAPMAPRRRATTSPRPLVEPVTSAVLPFMSMKAGGCAAGATALPSRTRPERMARRRDSMGSPSFNRPGRLCRRRRRWSTSQHFARGGALRAVALPPPVAGTRPCHATSLRRRPGSPEPPGHEIDLARLLARGPGLPDLHLVERRAQFLDVLVRARALEHLGDEAGAGLERAPRRVQRQL